MGRYLVPSRARTACSPTHSQTQGPCLEIKPSHTPFFLLLPPLTVTSCTLVQPQLQVSTHDVRVSRKEISLVKPGAPYAHSSRTWGNRHTCESPTPKQEDGYAGAWQGEARAAAACARWVAVQVKLQCHIAYLLTLRLSSSPIDLEQQGSRTALGTESATEPSDRNDEQMMIEDLPAEGGGPPSQWEDLPPEGFVRSAMQTLARSP